MGAENSTHSTSTTITDNDFNHTVIAAKESSSVGAPSVPTDRAPSEPQRLFPESLQITPATLVEVAPRLAPYMPPRTNDKSWPAIVDAALFLAGEMGINRTLWARACDVMGREYAAVALAIVSTRSAEHFTSGPGGYFAGMLRKFEKNPQDLCLSRSLWRLKDEAWGTEGHRQRRKVEQRRRREMRTKRSLHPELGSAGGFVPIGGVMQQPTPRPVPQARPRPNLSLSGTSKDWTPSQEFLELEERIKAMFAEPKNGLTGAETPRNGEKT